MMDAYENWGHPSQITMMIGPDLGDLSKLTSDYLPRPSIDLATRRMGDLIRQRHGEPNVPRTPVGEQ